MKLQGLYDMVGYKPEDKTQNKIDEQKFKKAIQNNKNLCRRNREMFEESEECFTSCIRYNPCPICDKCQNKASHLYVKCQSCQIPICTHKHNDRKFMIKRNNFKIKPSKELMEQLRSLVKGGE